jgi:K+-sensing histidine kinase KdpD
VRLTDQGRQSGIDFGSQHTEINRLGQNAGRPARQWQWSFGVQREIFKNLVVEASYVGNRGVWWAAQTLSAFGNRITRTAVGVLGMSPADAHALESPEQLHQLETFANQMALAIERAQASEDARRAEVRVEAERLRNSLLSSVSHDLRTPLASITGAASSLIEAGDQLGDATRAELLSSIHQEADRLDRLVNNLLEMTRLEAGGVIIRREWQPLEGVLGAVLKRLERRLRDREVHIDLPGELPLVPFDAMLIEQVLISVLENAAKYTPGGSAIDISAAAVGGAAFHDNHVWVRAA